MPRFTGVVLVAATALALSGCGQVAPTLAPPAPPSGTPTVTPTQTATTSPTPTISMTPTTNPSPTVSSSPSATPTASPTQTQPAKGVLLSGNGVGGHKFGTAEAKVEKALAKALGEPDESVQGILCELDSSSPWQRSVIYRGLAVVFTANSAKKSAPRTLNNWSLSLGGKLPDVQLEDGIPLDLSFKQLKAKYPKGKLTDSGLGDGSEIFTLPNGIRFVGVEVPDMVMAGELHYCE